MNLFKLLIRVLLPVLCLMLNVDTITSQDLIRHTTTSNNTHGSYTVIDHALTNKYPEIIIVIARSVNLPKSNGPPTFKVVYADHQWRIIAQSKQPFPLNAQFDLIIKKVPDKGCFTIAKAVNTNSIQEIVLDHQALNGNPAAKLLLTNKGDRFTTTSLFKYQLEYQNGTWRIVFPEPKPFSGIVKFNILIDEKMKPKEIFL